MKTIAVLTSGGDAPGMNAAIRAVVRAGLAQGLQVYGVCNGFQGLITGEIKPLEARSVSNVIQQGGTILGTARSPEFKTPQGQAKALAHLQKLGIEALVVIGGNGSQMGAWALSQKGIPVVGVASTIDNDLVGSDMTIGVDTALNIALEAIDRLKVTASSHRRGMVVEVMGRDSGHLALLTGVAGGAEAIVIPEQEFDPEDIAQTIQEAYQKGKRHALIVVAEGAKYNAKKLEEYFIQQKKDLGFELRLTILGHVQRGGAPTHFDRLLGTRLGVGAVESLLKGEYGVLVGLVKGEICRTPLSEVIGKIKPPDLHIFEMAKLLD